MLYQNEQQKTPQNLRFELNIRTELRKFATESLREKETMANNPAYLQDFTLNFAITCSQT